MQPLLERGAAGASQSSGGVLDAKDGHSRSDTSPGGTARDPSADFYKGKEGMDRRHVAPPTGLDKRNNTGLPGGRALGILALLAMSLCSAFMYAKVYSELLPVYLEPGLARKPKQLQGQQKQALLGQGKRAQQPVQRLSLREAVENVAGKDRSIIFCSTSGAYLDFTQNWFASVEKFNYGSRVLFIAEDEEALHFLSLKWPKQTVLVDPRDLALGQSEAGDAEEQELGNTPRVNSTYGSSHYNSLVDRRPEYFKALIDLHVSFLYNDVDIVWLKDPYPFFTGEFDMWVQEDAIELQLGRFADNHSVAQPIRHRRHAICTCFMFVHPTRASRRLVHRWSRHVQAKVHETGSAVLNQPAFNKALALTPDTDIKIGVLPVLSFPSGYIFFRCGGQPYCKKNWQEREQFWNEVKRRKSWPVMVHNNWLEGHDPKLTRFKEYDLWLMTEAQQRELKQWREQSKV